MRVSTTFFYSFPVWFCIAMSVHSFANALTLAPCTQTLSVGSNIASAVAQAPNNATICLNSGNYGTQDFSNINRNGFVTLRSVSGIGAAMSPQSITLSIFAFKL